MSLLWFLLFALVVAIVGGVLQANHNAKKERWRDQEQPDKLKNFRMKVNGQTYTSNLIEDPVTNDMLKETEALLNEARAVNKQWENTLGRSAELNNKGITYEKAGKIDKAIQIYEENIALGYPATHSYKRLMVLYRKQKDYNNEIRVIRRALEVFPKEAEYNQRLVRAELLNRNAK